MSPECPRCAAARACDPDVSEGYLQPSAERPGCHVCNACGAYYDVIAGRPYLAPEPESANMRLAEVLCCGDGELQQRDRPVGRWQRHVRWIVNGNVIALDWREVRSGYARGIMPTV